MIVDFHVHLFARGHLPRRWFEVLAAYLRSSRSGRDGVAELAARLEERMLDPDASHLVADMKAAGIDAVVSHPLDYGIALGEPICTMEQIVEHNAKLQIRHPRRYISFTSIDPRRPDSAAFVRATIRNFSLNGLNLYPPAGFDPASRECLAVCRVALEEDVPVLFHTGGANFPMRPRFGDPLLLGDVQAELPDLKIIVGHAGFPDQWKEAITVARRNPNVFLEISQWSKLAFKDYDKFVAILSEMKSEIGPRRILFGSDHLTGPGMADAASALSSWIQCLRRLPETGAQFSEEDVALILGLNAKSLLRIEGAVNA